MHETHTFSIMRADVEAFQKGVLGGFWQGTEVIQHLKGKNTETAGFIDVAESEGWELVPTVAGFANPCGRVTTDAFELHEMNLSQGCELSVESWMEFSLLCTVLWLLRRLMMLRAKS